MAWSTGRSLLAALLIFSASAAPLDLVRSYHLAQAAADRGKNDEALTAIDAALAAAGNRNDEIVWRLRILKALTLISFGDHEKVLAAATPELPPALRRSDVAVDRFRALAIGSYKASRLADARRYIDEAQRLAAEAHPALLPQVLLVRANMSEIFDAHARERDARKALRASERSGDVKLQMRLLGTLGNIAATQERFDEAIDFAGKTLRLATSEHNDSLVHRVEGNLGWYFNELGDRDSAEEHLRTAFKIATRLHADDDRIVYLLELGESEMSRGDLASAHRDVAAAGELAAKLKSRHSGDAMLHAAEVAFLGGDVAGAAVENANALRFNETANDRVGVQRARILDARIAMAGAKLDEARATLEQVLADAEAKSVRWEAESWLAQVCAARHDADLADEHFRKAIETVDEARRDVRKDELRLSVPDLATQLYDAYIEFLIGQGRKIDALRIAELNRGRTLAEGLNLDGDRKFEPEKIARNANVVALSYHLGRARSFLWAITPAGVELFPLPPAETIERAVGKYQETFATARGTIETGGGRGEELYRMLIGPAANALRGVSRVAIIPSGPLAAFNFETLVVPSPRRYWLEDVTIATAPSLQFLTRAQGGGGRGRLLLIGNATPPDRALPPLLYANEEMRRVKMHFDQANTLGGRRATPRAYLTSSPESYAFIHFVAHAVAMRQHPLDSAVILGADSDGYKLYARDIVGHRLTARLVTISSCHGAGRRTYQGEGLVGLAWAFLHAGAHEVIAALWEVNDRATPDLMDSMYAAIRAGHDPVDALRIAKLKVLHSGTIYRKPFYWAPFVVYTGS
jgi:CHAT domain-containing protein/tetratricopeptide (TPR) repeat protein